MGKVGKRLNNQKMYILEREKKRKESMSNCELKIHLPLDRLLYLPETEKKQANSIWKKSIY